MDARYQKRDKETIEGIAIGFRSQVAVSFHSRPASEELEAQEESEKRRIRDQEREDGECYPPLWASLWVTEFFGRERKRLYNPNVFSNFHTPRYSLVIYIYMFYYWVTWAGYLQQRYNSHFPKSKLIQQHFFNHQFRKKKKKMAYSKVAMVVHLRLSASGNTSDRGP